MVSTAGFTVIHLDRGEILEYCTLRFAGQIFHDWTHPSDPKKLESLARQFVEQLQLAETEDQSAASDSLSKIRVTGGQTANERAEALFTRKDQGWLSPYADCLKMLQKYDRIQNVDFPSNVIPRLEQQLTPWLKEIKAQWISQEIVVLREKNGPANLGYLLKVLDGLMAEFQKINTQKWKN